MKKGQVNEIYVTRAIAIIAVLIVHATSFAVAGYDPSSSTYGLYNFTNTFFRFGTPTFIFLSSFVLFYSYYHRPLTKELMTSFYKKRLLYIILPYVIFSALYYLYSYPYYSTVFTNKEMVFHFLELLAVGKASSHLYFVFISIQFYILFPLFLWFFKKQPKWVIHAVWIGFVLQWAFRLLNGQYFHITNTGSIAFSYMSYYFLGITLGVYFDKIVAFLNVKKEELFSTRRGALTILLWVSWLGAGIAHAYLWHWTRTTGNWADVTTYDLLWNVHTYLSALVATQASFKIYHVFSEKIVNGLIHLGVVSFGVYLIHLLILNPYQTFLSISGSSLVYHGKMIGGFFVTLILSWVIVGLFTKYVPYAWVLFGATPKKVPYKKGEKQKRISVPSGGRDMQA